MSRSVTIRELQNNIQDLRAWRDDDAPPWSRGLLTEIADLLEQIVCARDIVFPD